MTEKIIIAGAGGQGIMLLGKVLAESALKDGYQVSWFPSYGAEVRGGSAHCMVIISSEDIASPYIDKADSLIAMNQPSLVKFKQKLGSKGLLLINSSLVIADKPIVKTTGMHKFYLPFTETAVGLGNIRIANMIALGSYLAKKDIFSKDVVFSVIKAIAPAEKRDLIKINKQAIEAGMNLIK